MGRSLATLLIAILAVSTAAAHTELSTAEAHAMILSDESLIVLDVREYSEFCGSLEHIENAANLPWVSGALQTRLDELALDARILVVCASGGRSHQAATFLDGQGFTNVFDMQGGMSAWAWETEACDQEPVVMLGKTPAGPEIDWTPVGGTQDYDLIRGVVDNILDAGTYVDLGPAECLSKSSPFTYHTDPVLIETAYFYLARQVLGSWGESSDQRVRTPAPPDCP